MMPVKKRISKRTLMAVALLVAAFPATPSAATPSAHAAGGVDSAVTRNVIIVSIDGLRPDAIDAFELSTLKGLMEEGSYTLEAQTIFPSKTLPSHTSMLTGRTPEFHGITFNSARGDESIVQVPTIFEIARQHGHSTAAFFSKAKFRHLDREGAYDYRRVPSFNADNWMATRTVPEALQYMEHRAPNLLFIHIGETDYAGHGAGWMSFFYGVAARRADAAVKRIVEAADESYGTGNYTLIVTSDHGGHGRDHGSDAPEDMTIPWIAYGNGVERGARPEGVRTMDTAATALWLLGVPVPASFEGTPVHGAFAVVVAGAVAGP